jgi:hypothetical protein
MIIEIKPWQMGALGIGAVCWGVQTWGGWKVANANDKLLDQLKETKEEGNRIAYLSLYLLVKLAENDVELDVFDRQILRDPPKLYDKDHPTLFDEFLTALEHSENPEEEARELLERLREVREADDD